MRALVLFFGVSLLPVRTLQAQVSQQNFSRPEVQTTDSATLRVTFLGTGGGPRPNPSRYGASILVQAGTEDLLFDCGRGVTIRLVQAGIPLRRKANHFQRGDPSARGISSYTGSGSMILCRENIDSASTWASNSSQRVTPAGSADTYFNGREKVGQQRPEKAIRISIVLEGR
jgi:hypothetical protein